jgi:nicotinamidase-related amidase
MRILKEETAAVVVDIQEKLLPHIFEGKQVLENSIRLIEGLKILSVPVIVTQQYTRGLGQTVQPVAQLFSDFHPVEKITFSCCDEPSFREELDKTQRKYVILCGIEAHVCVLQTCLDLLSEGKVPVVANDCISSRKAADKETAVERMRQEGAVITTLESILFELTRLAGNPVFKAISGIVK